MRLKTMILSMKVLLLGAAVTTATATATAQGTTRTTGTERTVHAGDHVTTITVDGTPTTITNDVKSVTAAKGAKVKVTAAPPQQGKRARLVITKAASSTSGQTQSGSVTKIEVKGEDEKTTINVYEQLQMVATVEGTGDFDNTVSWLAFDFDNNSSSLKTDLTFAYITTTGLLTGLAAGKIRVIAISNHDNSTMGYCDIEVKDPKAGGSGQQGGENGGGDQPQTGENGGGQGTGEVTPGTNPGGQGTGGGGTTSEHDLKIIVPNNVTQIKAGDYIILSATYFSVPAPVNWSVDDSSFASGIATIDSSGCLYVYFPGNVRVTATFYGNDQITAYQDFQIVEY